VINLHARTLPLLLVASLLFLLTAAATASADTIYVDAASGADANTGVATAPVQTIGRATTLARSGDVVEVGAGRYPETVSLSQKSSGVQFRAADGARPIIDGDGIRAFGFKAQNVDGAVISGFEVVGQVDAGIYVRGAGNAVRDNVVHDVGTPAQVTATGIRIASGHDNEVSHNVVYGIGPGSESMGIWLVQTAHATVDRNAIYLVRKEGIRDWQGLDNTITSNRSFLNQTGLMLNTSTGTYAANNVLYQNIDGFVAKHVSYHTVLDFWNLPTAHMSQLWHNTVYSSSEAGLWFGNSDEPMDHLDVEDNLIGGGGFVFIRDIPSLRGPNVVVDNNLYFRDGQGPSAIYKEGWNTNPPALTDWGEFTSSLDWEAHGRMLPAVTLDDSAQADFDYPPNSAAASGGTALADGYGDQVGARGVPAPPMVWAPFPMTPIDSSSRGSWSTRKHLNEVSDNNQYTYWLTDTGRDEFVTLDFGTQRTFNTLIVTVFRHMDTRNAHGYRFDVSDDNQNWRTVAEGVNPDTAGSSVKYRLEQAVAARYLRYTLVDTSCEQYAPRTQCGDTFIVSDVAAGLLSKPAIGAPMAGSADPGGPVAAAAPQSSTSAATRPATKTARGQCHAQKAGARRSLIATIRRLKKCLRYLPPRWARFLSVRAGLSTGRPMARREASRRVGIHANAAASIEKRALRRLRSVAAAAHRNQT
jgi:hypothetical protein